MKTSVRTVEVNDGAPPPFFRESSLLNDSVVRRREGDDLLVGILGNSCAVFLHIVWPCNGLLVGLVLSFVEWLLFYNFALGNGKGSLFAFFLVLSYARRYVAADGDGAGVTFGMASTFCHAARHTRNRPLERLLRVHTVPGTAVA